MKQVFIINLDCKGMYYGVGTYTHQLIQALNVASFQITVVTLYAHFTKEFSSVLKDDIRYIDIPIPCSNMYFQLFYTKDDGRYQKNAFYCLFPFIPQNEEVYFHVNYLELEIFGRLLKQYVKCKIITTVHYMDWSFELLGDIQKMHKILESSLRDEREENIVQKFYHEKVFLDKISDYVIAIARHSYISLCSLYNLPPSKITLIPNGLKDTYVNKNMDEKRNLRKKYFIKDNDKLILFVGRLAPVKGIDYLIKAFKLLLLKDKNIRLFIVGEGSEDDFKWLLNEISPAWSRVTFTGFISKEIVCHLYSISDIGIIPSLHEEFGYVAIEMLMNELLVAANNSTGLKELLKNDTNGFLFHLSEIDKENSINMLSSYILSVLNMSNQKEIIRNGRNIFLSQYNLPVFIENIRYFYKYNVIKE
jgi:glycosyltransferase